MSDKIAVTGEGYELKFLKKNYARLLASVDTTTVIVPDEEHNTKPENATSENVYISGDNLDGIKHLLKSYAGQVKCIYIDPPYTRVRMALSITTTSVTQLKNCQRS